MFRSSLAPFLIAAKAELILEPFQMRNLSRVDALS